MRENSETVRSLEIRWMELGSQPVTQTIDGSEALIVGGWLKKWRPYEPSTILPYKYVHQPASTTNIWTNNEALPLFCTHLIYLPIIYQIY